MMFILGTFLGVIIGMTIIMLLSTETTDGFIDQNSRLIKEQENLINENAELKEIRINAERRATEYARKIKQIENIVLQKGQGSIVDRFDKIKEVIVGQNK